MSATNIRPTGERLFLQNLAALKMQVGAHRRLGVDLLNALAEEQLWDVVSAACLEEAAEDVAAAQTEAMGGQPLLPADAADIVAFCRARFSHLPQAPAAAAALPAGEAWADGRGRPLQEGAGRRIGMHAAPRKMGSPLAEPAAGKRRREKVTLEGRQVEARFEYRDGRKRWLRGMVVGVNPNAVRGEGLLP